MNMKATIFAVLSLLVCGFASTRQRLRGLGEDGAPRPLIWRVEDQEGVKAYLIGTSKLGLFYRPYEGDALSLVDRLFYKAQPDVVVGEDAGSEEEEPLPDIPLPLARTLFDQLDSYPVVEERLGRLHDLVEGLSTSPEQYDVDEQWSGEIMNSTPFGSAIALHFLLERNYMFNCAMASDGLSLAGYIGSLGTREGAAAAAIETQREAGQSLDYSRDIPLDTQMVYLNMTLAVYEALTRNFTRYPPSTLTTPQSPVVYAWKQGDRAMLERLFAFEECGLNFAPLKDINASKGSFYYEGYFSDELLGELEARQAACRDNEQLQELFSAANRTRKEATSRRNQLWLDRVLFLLANGTREAVTDTNGTTQANVTSEGNSTSQANATSGSNFTLNTSQANATGQRNVTNVIGGEGEGQRGPCRPLFVFALEWDALVGIHDDDLLLTGLEAAGYNVTRVVDAAGIPARGADERCEMTSEELEAFTEGDDWPRYETQNGEA